jgi:anti-sigma B factor antagonist
MTWSPSEPSQIQCHVRTFASGRRLEISIAGEVDLANAGVLRHTLCSVDLDGVDAVTLELSGLTFCDSIGCQVLLTFEHEARLSGRRTRISGATPIVSKVLTILAPDIGQAFI